MQDDLTDLVHSILQHGIQLKKRLMRGEPLVLENEQAILKRMLLTEADAQRWSDYGGEPFAAQAAPASRFLGIRYALVCWLDEIFLVDSPWDSRWNESKLELGLYGSNDRAWRFWDQARLAEARPTSDALSAFFLCVMLGFRGDLGEHPDQLQAWVESSRRRLTRSDGPQWVRPPEITPVTNVPPLRGRESLRRMIFSGGVLLLILFPLLAFFLVFLFVQPRDVPFRAGKSPSQQTPAKTDSNAFPGETP
ncbi:MAG: DotU family type IV/VI secretion system protein [Planctomycetes bacterium]|nr:DotU family type IV/VI secretion system protein [Planctomycetota bacterium]